MQIDNREKQVAGRGDGGPDARAQMSLPSRENALLTWMSGSKEWLESVQFDSAIADAELRCDGAVRVMVRTGI